MLLTNLLMAAVVLAGQQVQQTGIIAGAVIAPPPQKISQPLQVILLSPRYLELWHDEVQKRLDLYWQRYQPTFRDRKEYFLEFSKQAHKDATNYVLNRMQGDLANKLSEYFGVTSPDGKFEFKYIPFG